MLTAEQIDNWVDALNSGKYVQGGGRLRTTKGTYCCLGVLADTLGCTWDDHNMATLEDQFYKAGADLPGDIVPHAIQAQLIAMNDYNRNPFNEIAVFIKLNKDEIING